jgi:serine/threonine-protein kinase
MYRRLLKDHANVATALTGLAWVLLDEGHAGEAESLLRQAMEIRRKTLPAGHPDTAVTESLLGASLVAQGRHAEAEPLLIQSYARTVAARTDRARESREARARIRTLYAAWGKPEKARAYGPP